MFMLHHRKTKNYTYKNIFIYRIDSVAIWHYHLQLTKTGLHSYQKAVFECNTVLASGTDQTSGTTDRWRIVTILDLNEICDTEQGPQTATALRQGYSAVAR